MTTTDTDALKKRFARALYVTWWTDHMQDPSASYDHPLNEDAREACESAADALLPIVADEVLALLDQLDQAEAELDSWMARAYEAEKRAWQAEARIKAVRDVIDWAESRTPGVRSEHRAVHIADIRRALESVHPPRSE